MNADTHMLPVGYSGDVWPVQPAPKCALWLSYFKALQLIVTGISLQHFVVPSRSLQLITTSAPDH